jgi:ABC-type nitrate/sulfonate/bicarbonate transport system ATPase subunit
LQDKTIKIKNLSKFFPAKDGEVCIFDNISMEIENKEFIVILGPSGSGKSTFLKVLGGIEAPSSGSITLEGIKFEKGIPREMVKNIGFVFQDSNLLPWRTTEKNLNIVLEIQKLKSPEWKSRIDEMLKIVGLLEYKKLFPHELSGGMQQRVSIARALVHDPKVLLMDQPLGALDAITRKILCYELLKIWKKTQKTIIMVTNNVDEAVLLGNRIFIFSHLPAKIINEIVVDIPVEEKGPNIIANKRYNEIRKFITDIIKNH